MSHFYRVNDGVPEACHFQRKKDGTGNRPTTVFDARKLSLLPSPTTVLATLAKPALVSWLVRQGVYAVSTDPGKPGESLDDKITRVLDVEQQHEEESSIARDRGTAIHDAIETALSDFDKPEKRHWPAELNAFVLPVVDAVLKSGRVMSTEKILVNTDAGYAGKCDCITENDEAIKTLDFKTCKTIPKKGAYVEAKMQVASYAKALGNTGNKRIECAVIYISKESPGEIKVCPVEEWGREYLKFETLLRYWYLANDMPMPRSMEKPLPF